jgi:hypothetical protein
MLTHKKYLSLLMGLTVLACPLIKGQTIRPFTQIFSQNIKGGTAIFGNTSMQIIDNSTANLQKMNESGNPANGVGGYGFSQYGNDEENMQPVIADFQIPILNLIQAGENWNYSSSNSDLGTSWQALNKPAGNWINTNGSFGYGRNQNTTIPHAVTNYFLKTISVATAALYSTFDFSISYDDAAVVYVNGVEVKRLNMPAGVINFNSTALSANFSTWETWSIPSSYFNAGNNIVAVEIHQITPNNTTCFFDMRLSATPAYTSNSSTADLVLPGGINNIKFARLYWGGKIPNSVLNTYPDTLKKIKIRKGISGVYTDLVSVNNADTYIVNGSTTAYQSYVDVKDFIQNNGTGTYSIAEIPMIEGSAGYGGNYAGWCIIIAYENNLLPLNSVRIYDGFSQVYNNGSSVSQTITLTGLNVPNNTLALSDASLSLMAWEGDANISSSAATPSGDYLKINGITVSNIANPGTNFFNGSISKNGAFVNSKNPDFTNQMGIDIDELEIGSGYGILPNATEIQLEFGTEADKYFPGVFALTVKMGTPTSGPLPVKLISFSAVLKDKVGYLTWSTENELDNKYFDIERSEDGIIFKKIGSVQSNGTTSITQYYQYNEEINSTVSVIYYRLKIVNLEGKFTYSKIVPLKLMVLLNNQISVYPNPFVHNFKISLNISEDANTRYRILSFDGKEIISRNVFLQKGTNIIVANDLSEIAAGNYILEIDTGSKRYIKKLIKIYPY